MSYPGGKGAAGVAQTIINQQPPHDRYMEPFLGGGSVMRIKRPARINIGMDMDAGAVAAFDDGTRPGTFYVADGIAALRKWRAAPADLVYCDPPYLLTARRRNRRIYRCELEQSDHIRLLVTIRGLNCMVQISGYWSSLYAQMLEGWRLVRFMAMTRGGLMEECLWMNYPEPSLLHDYRFLGSDFRDRERIKRKTARWTARIAGLPTLERVALLSAMSAEIANCGVSGSHAGSDDRIRRRPSAASAIPAIIDRTTSETVVLQ